MQLDLIVLVIFAFMIFLIGAAFTRMGSKSGWAFFEAGGATPWWINGLSLFISYFSSHTAFRGSRRSSSSRYGYGEKKFT